MIRRGRVLVRILLVGVRVLLIGRAVHVGVRLVIGIVVLVHVLIGNVGVGGVIIGVGVIVGIVVHFIGIGFLKIIISYFCEMHLIYGFADVS